MPAAFTRDANLEFPAKRMQKVITEATAQADFVAASQLAQALTGNSVAANLFMLGYA
jgi:indolepyruvate ferredoxin oxidoreductase